MDFFLLLFPFPCSFFLCLGILEEFRFTCTEFRALNDAIMEQFTRASGNEPRNSHRSAH